MRPEVDVAPELSTVLKPLPDLVLRSHVTTVVGLDYAF
jgi:hypothetical protein